MFADHQPVCKYDVGHQINKEVLEQKKHEANMWTPQGKPFCGTPPKVGRG